MSTEVKCDTRTCETGTCCKVDYSKPLTDPKIVTNKADYIDPREINWLVRKVRDFFESKGFMEVYCQNRANIMSSCENPKSIGQYNLGGNDYPLPQTSQMILEDLLLDDPTLPGLFTLTTSYRDEKDIIPGRHNIIFPLFEFEKHGDINELQALLLDLVKFMGFKDEPRVAKYNDLCQELGTEEIEAEQERKLCEKNNVILITNFPEHSSPFFNMKRNDDGTSQKIDVILYGNECMGCASRATEAESQRKSFETISDGKYAEELFKRFGKERVRGELEQFLTHDFVPRFGGGIGMGERLLSACRKEGLMPKFN